MDIRRKMESSAESSIPNVDGKSDRTFETTSKDVLLNIS